MDDGRWQIAKRIFSKALTLPPDRRPQWVEAECDDEGLRFELLELLAAHDDVEPSGVPDVPPEIPPAEGPGVTIDRYKLLQQIGEGGFGTVYMAAQTEPVERRVALKIIKAGMDSDQVIARFEAERQALALMDHPNIAKVLDAGTTAAGRPYFVMELVKGIEITEYCDQQQLGPKRRLELFIQVCHGVQHAHQKGIIHRDLKPSNVLVAEYDHAAVPKIIDFGVAKAMNQRLTVKTVFTEFGQLVGTFEYMSPEQAKLNQLDIDTRSDVYSLGVLLYKLLTGTTPLRRERLHSEAFDELLRIIREEEPPKPSTRVSTLATANVSAAVSCPGDPRKLSRMLRGDLDWVVMCALDKERSRRYESAGSFAEDLERHLSGEVVRAGPPSTMYRLRKFARRHRGPVIAACALVLMLILGLAGTSLGLVQARAARESERRLTFRMALDRGLSLCDEGSVGPGMLWLARALELSPPEETAMRRVIRANLSAWRQEFNSIEMIYPHESTVVSVAIGPDGDVLATGSADETAQLWSLQTGERIHGPLRHRGQVHELVFSPDGSRLVTAAMDSTAFAWDTKTGKRLLEFRDDTASPRERLSGGTLGCAFRRPEGRQVVTSYGDGTVKIWDAASGKAVGRLRHAEHAVHDVVVNADGSRLLTACHDGTAKLWDLDSGQLLATFHHGAHSRTGAADFLGADESQVVTGGGDGHIYLWNVSDAFAREDRTLEVSAEEFADGPWKHHGNVHRLRVGPERSRVLTASFDSTSLLFAPGKRAGTRSVFEHHASVQAVAFSPDGSRIATASNDGLARLWRPATGLAVRSDARPTGLHEAAYSADGRYLLTKPDKETALICSTATGARLCELADPGATRAVAVGPDGTKVLTGTADSVTRIWEVSTGKLLHEKRRLEGAGIWTVVFSPDGTRTVVGDFDGSVEVRDVISGELVGKRFKKKPRVQCVTFSPDGSRIAVSSDDGLARIFRTGDWSAPLELAGHRSTVSVVAFSRDGKRVVTGGFDNTARVWDAATGAPLSDPLRHEGPIFFVAAALSPDGRTAVTGCNDKTARLWDVATSQPIGPALRHEAAVHMVEFTGDAQVVSGTAKGTVRHWDVQTSPLEGDLDRITLWLQVASGFELDSKGSLVALDAESWKQRRARLDVLGGPPDGR